MRIACCVCDGHMCAAVFHQALNHDVRPVNQKMDAVGQHIKICSRLNREKRSNRVKEKSGKNRFATKCNQATGNSACRIGCLRGTCCTGSAPCIANTGEEEGGGRGLSLDELTAMRK